MITVTQENINGYADYSVNLVNIIISKYQIPGRLKEMLYVSFLSYLIEYGYDKIEDIYNTFASIGFNMTPLSVSEYLKKNNIEPKGVVDNYINNAPAITMTNVTNEPGRFSFSDTIIVSTAKDYSPIFLLEALLHEINHLFFSQKNRLFTENNKLYGRTGLAKFQVMGTEESGRAFNEVINTLQSEKLVQNILDLCDLHTDNPYIGNVLEKIKKDSNKKYECLGYEALIPLFRELFENKQFSTNLNTSLFEGDLTSIQVNYEKNTYFGKYNEMINKCDQLLLGLVADDSERTLVELSRDIYLINAIYISNSCSKKY